MQHEAIEVKLTTPSIRLEDLNRLVDESTESVLGQVNAAVDPLELHRFETVVSVKQLD